MGSIWGQILFFMGYLTQNVFPQPLTEQKEREYLERMLQGDEEAKCELIRHNLRLVAHIAKKFDTVEENDDLISIGTIGLIKGINTFKPDKGVKLATYVARCAENEILMHLRSQKKRKCEVSMNESVGIDKEGNEITLQDILGTDTDTVAEEVENAFECELLKHKLDFLTKRERDVLEMRFGLGAKAPMTQREIGKKMNISRSYVSRIEKKAVERLRELLFGAEPKEKQQ